MGTKTKKGKVEKENVSTDFLQSEEYLAFKLLFAHQGPVKKDAAFRRFVKSCRGKLADMGYSSDDFNRDKQKEIEAENR